MYHPVIYNRNQFKGIALRLIERCVQNLEYPEFNGQMEIYVDEYGSSAYQVWIDGGYRMVNAHALKFLEARAREAGIAVLLRFAPPFPLELQSV
jgi:hypothetical protein